MVEVFFVGRTGKEAKVGSTRPVEPVASRESGPQGLSRRPSRSAATTIFSTEVFDNEVVPSSLSIISPILRAAKEIEHERPRVAYLCMLALEPIAHL
ncbi:hypothetical protein NL676_014164 [Syzygium grande]|nr:hypothetical protein NL676_014164 [Syzygium grande]